LDVTSTVRRCRDRSRFTATVWLVIVGVAALMLAGGCSDDDPAPTDPFDPRSEFGLASLGAVPYPPDNPPIPERIALGRLLFFDPILSGRRDVSCGHCHHPALAWGDGRARGIGVTGEVPGIGPAGVGPDRVLTEPETFLETPRNTPTCMNAACSAQPLGAPDHRGLQFWDGRADGLEPQSALPITSFDEMAGGAWEAEAALDSVLVRLQAIAEYVSLFRDAFPDEAAEMDQYPERHVIRGDTYRRALAAYQRELIFGTSPYDRYVDGDDDALGDRGYAGLLLFFGDAHCSDCHHGPMLSSFEFSVTGVDTAGPGREPVRRGGDGMDWGRWEHTGDEFDRHAFRIPTLRNIELTAPYFHTGEATTLEDVVQFYARGGNDLGLAPWRLDDRLRPLDLADDQVADLVAFLRTLTDRTVDSDLVDLTVPLAVPSGLIPPEPLEPFSRVP
jgi:cytochrome c peroxidase